MLKRRFGAVGFATLITLCGVSSSCKSRERAYIPKLEGEWVSILRDGSPEGKGRVIASVPADESFELWTRMITIQFMKGAEESPHEMMDRILARLAAKCPELVSNVIEEDEQTITYEWRIDECPAAPDQHELARLIRGRAGLHRVAFVRKGQLMPPDERDKWLGVLAQVVVVDGSEVIQAPPEPPGEATLPEEISSEVEPDDPFAGGGAQPPSP